MLKKKNTIPHQYITSLVCDRSTTCDARSAWSYTQAYIAPRGDRLLIVNGLALFWGGCVFCSFYTCVCVCVVFADICEFLRFDCYYMGETRISGRLIRIDCVVLSAAITLVRMIVRPRSFSVRRVNCWGGSFFYYTCFFLVRYGFGFYGNAKFIGDWFCVLS